MKIKSQRDFFSGLMFLVVGAGFAWGATNYTIGEGARMGPGYFPLVLGVVLALLGVAGIFSALVFETEDGEPVGSIAWKPLIFIIGANIVFGILLAGVRSWGLPAAGLIVAIYALVIISSMAGPHYSLKNSLILATVLAIGSYLIFVLGLNLQFQVWPAYFTR